MIYLAIGVVLTILPFFSFKRKPPVIPADKKEFYAEYMQSNEWRIKRGYRLKIDKHKCRDFHLWPCRKNLQVHHKNYNRLGNERMSDIITLCVKHHRKAHKK